MRKKIFENKIFRLANGVNLYCQNISKISRFTTDFYSTRLRVVYLLYFSATREVFKYKHISANILAQIKQSS